MSQNKVNPFTGAANKEKSSNINISQLKDDDLDALYINLLYNNPKDPELFKQVKEEVIKRAQTNSKKSNNE